MNSITRGIQAVSALILVLVAPMSLTVAQEPGKQGGSSPAPPAMEGLDRMTTPERGGKDMEERIRHFEAKRREKLLQALQLDDAMTGLRRERLQVARDLLTPEQQVKFLLFTVRFQKEMHERLLRERSGPEGGR